MQTYLTVAQMVISVALVMVLMFQVRGGGLGGIFGQADTVYRTKRGVEKTLFQFTVILAVLFVTVSLLILGLA